MITKERIDELIKNRAKIYSISKSGEVFCLGLKFREHTLNNKKWLENKYEVYSKFYENKEDAEFVAKYHTSRVEKFEPPTYEEFLKLNNQSTCWDFMNKENQRNFVLVGNDYYAHNDMIKPKEEWTVVVQDEYDDYIFEEPLTKENYYKAVERARKLFLGLKGEEDA